MPLAAWPGSWTASFVSHRMKPKILFIIVAVGCVLVITAFVSAYHAVTTIARYQNAQDEVGVLAIFLADHYRDPHGQYPASLAEAVSRLDDPFRERAEQILHDKWHGNYRYQPVASGFVVTVQGFRFEYQPRSNGYVVMGRFTTNTVTSR
jgi:hypothetical protein